MLSKSLLEWPTKASAQRGSSREVTSVVTEKSGDPLDAQAWAPKTLTLLKIDGALGPEFIRL